MIINKNTDLNLINARWGSRLTLNLNFMKHSIETGNLGLDPPNGKQNRYYHQKLQQLGFYVKSGISEGEGFYFSKMKSYLSTQELFLGLTYMKLNGIHSSELNIVFTIHNPITIAPKLECEEDIKLLHSPVFIVEIEIENSSKINQKLEAFIGFDMEGKLINNNLIFEDSGKNKIEKAKNNLVLKNLQQEYANYYVDEKNEFRGFLANKELKPREKFKLKYLYAGFVENYVFLNKLKSKNHYKLKFYYTKYFTDIDNLLEYIKHNYDNIIKKSESFENLLSSYEASEEKKFLIAIAFRTFLANTWLLISDNSQPEYYVSGGFLEYNSSVDLAMEIELIAKMLPWTLELQLKEWKKYITINKKNGFYYLMHDMGSDQEVGYSNYDKKNNDSKPLAIENNANFAILLYWYYSITKDKELIDDLYPSALKLLMGNIKRGFRKSGIANIDIFTTYNASETLHNAPLNSYLGIKQCVSYIMFRQLSLLVGANKDAEIMRKESEKILDTLEYIKNKYGYIPISLDTDFRDWSKKTITTADPLFYIAMTGLNDPIINKIINILIDDFDYIYHNLNTQIYGIRLVENEEITWFSKIAIIDAVSTILFKIPKNSWNYAYEWNKNNPLAYCDGAFSKNKEWSGTRSPRGISLMWKIIYNYNK